MKEVFIHIGAHKTGTTSFQSVLFNNYENLKSEYNILYPKSIGFQYGQHRLAFSMKGMSDPKQKDIPNFDIEINKLLTEIEVEGLQNVIISSEEFFSVSEESLLALGQRLQGFRVNIIAVLRRQDSMFISIYNQKVKSPDNDFFVHYSRFLDNPILLDDELDYWKHLKKWAGVFGKENMSVQLYEQHEDMVSYLINNVCLIPITIDELVRMNKSISIKALELLRHVKFFEKDPYIRRHLFKKASQQFINRNNTLLSDIEKRKILDFFRIDNQECLDYFNLENIYASLPNEDSEVSKLTVNDVVQFMLNNLEIKKGQ